MTQNNNSITPPDLEERFTQPKGWRSHHFESHGKRIVFGSVFPEDSIPDAVVVCLPGLSEFTEKYYEVAQTCLDMNLAFWVLDWPGQGRSDRYVDHPHKRHAEPFDIEVDRLHEFIMGYIKHSSVHPDKGRIPLAMLGHSMGANIGMHYLAKHPDTFECAAFSAPMFGIKALNRIPLSGLILKLCNLIAPKSYVFGGGDWHENMRIDNQHRIFSSDPVRDTIHNVWSKADPKLQVGSPTFGWLHKASKSCKALRKKNVLSAIKTACLITIAGNESIVDNDVTIDIVAQLHDAQLIEIADAGHEIMMETDDKRNILFQEFHALIEKTIIARPETLKPF